MFSHVTVGWLCPDRSVDAFIGQVVSPRPVSYDIMRAECRRTQTSA